MAHFSPDVSSSTLPVCTINTGVWLQVVKYAFHCMLLSRWKYYIIITIIAIASFWQSNVVIIPYLFAEQRSSAVMNSLQRGGLCDIPEGSHGSLLLVDEWRYTIQYTFISI